MTPHNGLFYGLPDHAYFADPALNASGIKQLLKSPAHYHAGLAAVGLDDRSSKALIIGSAVHCATLEPDVFLQRYAVTPQGIDKRTKEGKAQWQALEATGKTILSADDFETVNAVATSVRKHVTARALLDKGNAEVSLFVELDGINAKCRIDWLRSNLIVDLKTTDDASPEGFARSIAKYGYDIQAAWYLDCAQAAGLAIEAFIFIAVEKSAPYAVGIYELDMASLEVGRSKYQRAVSLYRHCVQNDEWPGYSPDIVTLNLPNWAMREAA